MRSFLAALTAALLLGVAAGSAPAGASSASPRSCGGGLLFCEDFERLPLGGPRTLD
ncbi:hypothetical protein [Micromonospora sp. WMMD980]|uniref:hypothetical protein n=1 Tax=Micromonospora sp. WMMD980 TaxID=3016088 RepID=UPI002417D572|nr:hypothetical protein [Micromonospora sp. WMMD980]MDG4800202.1 hypothetical protein [Micromonospora sp. WMMD980]